MSPTPKAFNWSENKAQKESKGPSSLSWGVNSLDSGKRGSSDFGWGGSNGRENTSGSSEFSSLRRFQENTSYVKTSNNNESLPKFSETFCGFETGNSFNSFKLRSSSSSELSWSANSSRRNSSETALFGDPKKKLDWDGLVENVFKEEIAKLSDKVQNKV